MLSADMHVFITLVAGMSTESNLSMSAGTWGKLGNKLRIHKLPVKWMQET